MMSLAYIALWCFVFTIPWENVITVTGVGAVSRLMGMVALGFMLLAATASGRFRRWQALHIAAFCFIAWAGAGQLLFGGSDRLSHKFQTYVQLFLMMWMIWELAVTRQRLLGLFAAYVAGAYVAALDTIFVFRHSAATMRRFAAEGFDANDLAMVFALAIPMAWYLGMTYHRPIVRWLARGYLPLGLLAVGLTGSRGGMLATVLGLMVIPLTMTKLTPSRIAAAVAMLGLAGALAAVYVPKKLIERLGTTGTQIEDRKLNGRWKIWVAGVQAFTQRPIAGYGSGSFKTVIADWLGPAAQVAHNSYISVLVEQGIVGFALYLTMFIAVFLALRRLPVTERRFTFVQLATLALAILPLSWEDNKSVWLILSVLLGFALAHVREMATVAPIGYGPLAPPLPFGPRPERAAAPLRRAHHDGAYRRPIP